MTNLVIGEVREAMRLWVPPGAIERIDPGELSSRIVTGQQAIEDFLNLQISPSELIEIVDSCGVDIDGYLDTVSFNLR